MPDARACFRLVPRGFRARSTTPANQDTMHESWKRIDYLTQERSRQSGREFVRISLEVEHRHTVHRLQQYQYERSQVLDLQSELEDRLLLEDDDSGISSFESLEGDFWVLQDRHEALKLKYEVLDHWKRQIEYCLRWGKGLPGAISQHLEDCYWTIFSFTAGFRSRRDKIRAGVDEEVQLAPGLSKLRVQKILFEDCPQVSGLDEGASASKRKNTGKINHRLGSMSNPRERLEKLSTRPVLNLPFEPCPEFFVGADPKSDEGASAWDSYQFYKLGFKPVRKWKLGAGRSKSWKRPLPLYRPKDNCTNCKIKNRAEELCNLPAAMLQRYHDGKLYCARLKCKARAHDFIRRTSPRIQLNDEVQTHIQSDLGDYSTGLRKHGKLLGTAVGPKIRLSTFLGRTRFSETYIGVIDSSNALFSVRVYQLKGLSHQDKRPVKRECAAWKQRADCINSYYHDGCIFSIFNRSQIETTKYSIEIDPLFEIATGTHGPHSHSRSRKWIRVPLRTQRADPITRPGTITDLEPQISEPVEVNALSVRVSINDGMQDLPELLEAHNSESERSRKEARRTKSTARQRLRRQKQRQLQAEIKQAEAAKRASILEKMRHLSELS